MPSVRNEGYKPLDLESNISSGQWRTIEEHERLQQEGAVPSSTALDPSGDFTDYYKQRQQHTKTPKNKVAWAVGGCCIILVIVVVAAVAAPNSLKRTSSQPGSSSSSDNPGSIQADRSSKPADPLSSSSSLNERGSRDSNHNNNINTTTSSSQGTKQGAEAEDEHHSNDKGGLWHEGGSIQSINQPDAPGEGFVPCKGPNLQCAVINKQPIPEADFRNLPRRATATWGLVASDNSRCSQIGRDVMESGGNAVDAAVATALCLGVVNPASSGLGGGAFITVRLANGTAAFYDARETAPGAATEDMFTGRPANASLFGGLAVAVPGELQGLEAVWKRFGSKPWSELVKPAADLARSGFAAHPYLVYIMSGAANLRRMQSVKALREAFLIEVPGKGWRAPLVGELCCRRPLLADTLDKIASQGASYLTSPAVTAAHAQELAAAGGIITAQELARAQPLERELLTVQLGDLELLVPPPPSSAAVVAFVLKFLAGYGNTLLSSNSTTTATAAAGGTGAAVSGVGRDVSVPLASFGVDPQRDKGLGMHRLVEAMKHGFAVRTALGDPGSQQQRYESADSIAAAVRDLLDDAFVDKLRSATRDDTVLDDTAYGGRWNPEGVAPPEEHGTSHFCVVDVDRNAVSLTTSINTPFGSGVVSPTTGILFGNTMDDFASPAKRTIVTPHPSKANFIAPGKRALSAMSPMIVLHKATGRLVAVAGASGGPLIVSATAQTLARLLLEGADVRHAVAAARLHDQLVPHNSSFYEAYSWGHTHHQMSPAVVAQLEARDQATAAGDRGMGVSQAIIVDYGVTGVSTESGAAGGAVGLLSSSQGRGVLIGASDSRKDGAPAGYGR